MSTFLQPEDYEKLYEDALWRLDQVLTMTSDDDGRCPATERQTSLYMARAHLDGILQQQSRAAATNGNRPLQQAAVAHRRVWRMSTAASVELSSTNDTDAKSRDSLSPHCLARQFHASADEFFQAYPETMRQMNNEDDDSSSSEEEDAEPRRSKSVKKNKKPNQQQQQQQQENVIDVDEPMSHLPLPEPQHHHEGTKGNPSRPFKTAPPPLPAHINVHRQPHPPPLAINPYAKTKKSAPIQQQSMNCTDPTPRPSSSSSHRSSGAFSYTPVEEETFSRPAKQHQSRPPPLSNTSVSSSWEDHHRQNPFQTAREFSAVECQNQSTAAQQQTQPGHYHHAPPPQKQRHNNPTFLNPYESEPTPEPPTIPESLKRKFQPPMLKRSGTTNNNNKGGGGVVSQKPQSQKEQKKDDNEDDEELPEPLKRFGKELVQKILQEIMDGGDPITFEDIAGLHDAKQTIQEVICWPMKRPDLFTGLRRAPNGLLLYGPPGTGKTLIGKAIAHESGATFFSISSSSLTSKWIGEGEKLVRTMFAVAAYHEPSVVFIDEIDSLLTQRKADENEASRRIKTEFLVQLDGTGTTAQGRVLTIGATNRPQELDEAARRRFVKRLYIPLPVEADRATLLQVLLSKNNHRLTPSDVNKLARETDGYSGADLKALCTDAAMGPIRQLGARALDVDATEIPPISYRHFRQSLRSMRPSVAPHDLVQYEEWDKIYGSKRVEEDMEDESSSDEAVE